jgi:hypothetical protein
MSESFSSQSLSTGHHPPADVIPGKCVYKDVYAFTFYLYAFAITPISLIGVVFNMVNLVVLGNMHKTSHTSVFLLRILAACDLFFLATCLIYFFVRPIVVFINTRIEVFARRDSFIGSEMTYASTPFYFSALQTRNWLIVLITFERFLNIVFPLWTRAKCTKGNLTKIAMFITSFSLLSNCPRFWFPLSNNINPCTGLPELKLSFPNWYGTYDPYHYIILLVLVPLFLIYIMNVVLLVAVRRATSRRAKLTASGQKDQDDRAHTQATLMVISILVLFTICESPASLDRLASLAGVKFADDSLFFTFGRKIGLLLVVVDSALNFAAYCISNRMFRQNLLLVCSGSSISGFGR